MRDACLFLFSPCKDPSPYLYWLYDQKICHPASDRDCPTSEYRSPWEHPLEDFFHDAVVVGTLSRGLYFSR